MDYKVKLTKCQNEHHHGVYLTRGPSGPRGRPDGPNSLASQLGFESVQPGTWLTRLNIGSQGRIQSLKAVEGKKSGRPVTWMANGPSICSNRPCQVGGDSPLPLYKPPYS
jgi:hypothetical protein